jgi:hypothetical protein
MIPSSYRYVNKKNPDPGCVFAFFFENLSKWSCLQQVANSVGTAALLGGLLAAHAKCARLAAQERPGRMI